MKDTHTPDELNEEIDGGQDNIASGSSLNTFVQRNGKLLIIVSVAVIVLVGLIVLFRSNTQKNEANAMKALARIEAYYLQSQYENALYAPDSLPTVRGEKVIGLVKIVDEYGSTKAGERAALFAADAYYQLGKYPEAKTYYEKAIHSGNDEIKLGGLAGTAACDEKDGKLKDAAGNYIKAVELITDESLQQRYLYFAGLCNEKAGEKDQAKKLYRQIVDQNKFGEFNNLAKAGIVRLGEHID